jgi:hypothetical protein
MYHLGLGTSALPTAEQEAAAISAAYAGGYDILGILSTPEQLAATAAQIQSPQAASTAAGLPSPFMQWVTSNAGLLVLGVGAFVVLLAVGRR